MQLSQDNYVDYSGVGAFNALNVQNVKFTLKYAPVTDRNPVPAILVHCSGEQTTSGILVNFDMWPRYEHTEEDIKALFNVKEVDGKTVYEPKVSLSNITFRIGYWATVDKEGKPLVQEGKPKWLSFFVGTEEKHLHGDAREFRG